MTSAYLAVILANVPVFAAFVAISTGSRIRRNSDLHTTGRWLMHLPAGMFFWTILYFLCLNTHLPLTIPAGLLALAYWIPLFAACLAVTLLLLHAFHKRVERLWVLLSLLLTLAAVFSLWSVHVRI